MRGVEPPLARFEALFHPVQEEDRVVGDDAEQQHHQHGLGVPRNPHPEPLAGPRDAAERDHVRDARREEVTRASPASGSGRRG